MEEMQQCGRLEKNSLAKDKFKINIICALFNLKLKINEYLVD
jgi:hypothetical protein